MKPPGSTENKITKDKNGEKVPHLEITEVVLVHFNIVNNGSRVLYTFAPNKPFGSLLEISPKNHIFKKTFNSELQTVEVWFTDQNSQPLEIEQVKLNNAGIIKKTENRVRLSKIFCSHLNFIERCYLVSPRKLYIMLFLEIFIFKKIFRELVQLLHTLKE